MKPKRLRRQYRKVIHEQMEEFESYLKPKPWWMPKFLWRKIASLVLKMDKIR